MPDHNGLLARRTALSRGPTLNSSLPPQQEKRQTRQLRRTKLLFSTIPISLLLLSVYFQDDLILVRGVGVGACHGYKGILHVAHGDEEGAAGSIFFLFVLNQLLYAEMHSLIPWVHLNEISRYVYDPAIHGKGNTVSFEVPIAVNASWTGFIDPISKEEVAYAGPPPLTDYSPERRPERRSKVTAAGNGVWSSYFYPVSRFSASDPSCTKLPLVRLTYPQVIPALHVNCPWSLKAWRYRGLPPSLRQKHLSYSEWFRPMRERGAYLLDKYVQFLPYLHQLAHKANPSKKCLALHIRHSDKGNRRRKIRVDNFLPYVKAFVEEQKEAATDGNFGIFLATDSHNVIQMIQETWPQDILSRIHWQPETVRSNDSTPVFTLASHHSTNVQVLVDIIAMSRCQFLLHGLSAVSEAVHYVNSDLDRKNRSVNLEVSDHASITEFQSRLKHTLSKGDVS